MTTTAAGPLFHIDTMSELHEGMILEPRHPLPSPLPKALRPVAADLQARTGGCLSPNMTGLLCAPVRYLTEFETCRALVEVVFELIRATEFPDRPSTWDCVFAARGEKTLRSIWTQNRDRSEQNGRRPGLLWEIEPLGAAPFTADGHWWGMFGVGTALGLIAAIRAYWAGEMTLSPTPEVLVPYPVRIARRAPETVFPELQREIAAGQVQQRQTPARDVGQPYRPDLNRAERRRVAHGQRR
jgi:hypothetical protein